MTDERAQGHSSQACGLREQYVTEVNRMMAGKWPQEPGILGTLISLSPEKVLLQPHSRPEHAFSVENANFLLGVRQGLS